MAMGNSKGIVISLKVETIRSKDFYKPESLIAIIK